MIAVPTVTVRGRFLNEDGSPFDEGEMWFTPSEMWILVGEYRIAVLAPHVYLESGRFGVDLTPVDHFVEDLSYKVELAGVGSWKIKPKKSEDFLHFADLVPNKKP